MTKIVFLFIRLVIYGIPFILLFWSITQYFAFSGFQEFFYDFSKESPFISILWPAERTSPIYMEDGDTMQDIEKDPTSFSIQLTRPNFQQATITVEYKKPENIPFKFGLQKGDGSWDFFFKEPVTTLNEDNLWSTGVVTYDITPEYLTGQQKINILLSSPYLSDIGSVITITKISVQLKRSPITLEHLLNKFGIFL